MAQIFTRAADTYLRMGLLLAALLVVGLFLFLGGFVRSDWYTRENVQVQQPVPFSHRHHAGQLGIDCRYCHTEVERASYAGYPPTYTCMTCHSQLWTAAEALAPVRESLALDEPLRWNRVYDLPDFVYFDHSIHVAQGIGCASCHGPVPEMVRIYKARSLHMSWCLECHRHPERHIRPRAAVFDFDWQPPADREAFGRRLVADRGIVPENLDSCYICHR